MKEENKNSVTIIVHKSNRKNAKTSDCITVRSIYNEIDTHSIESQFMSILDKILYSDYKLKNKYDYSTMYISILESIYKKESFVNANRNVYTHYVEYRNYIPCKKTYDIVKDLLYIFWIVYPNNTLDLFHNDTYYKHLQYIMNKYRTMDQIKKAQ